MYGIRNACPECQAPRNVECDPDCTGAQVADVEQLLAEIDNASQPCCPSPEYATATLCGCAGDGAAPVKRGAA